MTVFSTSSSPGNIFTVDNGGAGNPSNRLDQMGHTAGAVLFGGALIRPYDFMGPLPADVFIGSLFFGRTLQGPAASPPAMITDVGTRDFAGVLTGPVGNPLFLNMVFRQGDPVANGAITGLPLQAVGVGNVQLTIIDLAVVPEPATWGLLIAGFGMVGVAVRRRRVAPLT